MIFGNPNDFAIGWDLVADWDVQQPRFYEGLIYIIVDGSIVPRDKLASVNIWTNLRDLSNSVFSHEQQNLKLRFSKNPDYAYRQLYRYSFFNKLELKWEYRADCDAIADNGCNFFLVKHVDCECLYIGSDGMYINSINAPTGYFAKVVKDAANAFFEKYPSAKRFGSL